MRNRIVLTAVGHNRPGIVADLTEMIFDLGCNLEDSSMMRLGSEFALMLVASGRGEDLEQRFRQASNQLERDGGMTIFVRPISRAMEGPIGRTWRLRTLGVDKAGIVARSARAVAAVGGDIVQLSSSLRPAAGSGTPIYQMEMTFELPDGADAGALRTRLNEIENTLNIEVTLTES
jgi:glycine cleavage system transcriptional repressor